MALFLLRDRFTREEKKRCFDFYDRVTTHDSSLSMAAFSVIASEVGDTEKAYGYFRSTARLDLDDTHNNTKDGLHMANMAGTWMCVVNGFAGMHAGENGLSFTPTLPQGWHSYSFSLHYRGRRIRVEINADGARFTRVCGEPMTIVCNGQAIEV